jgi:GNAT superfamily N-acetyltransferase
MALTFALDPSVDEALRDDVLRLWVDVSNAGGSVGFVTPVTPEDVRPRLLKYLRAIADGRARLLVGRDADGRVAATAFLVRDDHRLMRHWTWLHIVMVRPSLQRQGLGRRLLSAAADAARSWDGVEAIRLTLLGGRGLEHFYGSCGYQEVGRVPGAFKVADDDFCDEVTMWLTLT